MLKTNDVITDATLEKFPPFREFRHGNSQEENSASIAVKTVDSETPEETVERVYREINAQLADDLLTSVLAMSPEFFEQLVVDLLNKMGYGGYEGAGFRTKASNDGGIDGIIPEDKLGFNLIYIQAKRWSPDTRIGKPEIQKFMGALAGPPKIDKGLYITTAQFTQGAKDYADAQHIILVDGSRLTDLMIEFGLGVFEEKVYKIRKMDTDYFSED